MPAGTLPLLLALAAPPAGAAEITALPPWLRADVGVSYGYGRLAGSLVEGDVEVGSRAVEAHRIVYSGVFSAGPGIGAFVEAEQIVQERVSFPTANEMAFDPSGVHAGTMDGTAPLESVWTRDGAGFQGIWIGLRATPFSEAFPKRRNLATWLVEAAWRTANDAPFWTVENDDRGAGVGGSAWRVASAFSTRKGAGEPYLGVSWIHTNAFTTDLQNLEGAVTASGVELTGPDVLDIRTGIEFTASEDPSGSRFGIDLRAGVTYRTWETLPSGIMLPEALALTEGIPVTGAESTSVRGGLALYWRVFRYMQVNLGGDVGWVVPHEIEHPYPILTGPDTLDIQVGGGFRALIR